MSNTTLCRNCKYSSSREFYPTCDNMHSPCYQESHTETPEACTLYEDSYDYRRDTLILSILTTIAAPNPQTALDLKCLQTLIEYGY